MTSPDASAPLSGEEIERLAQTMDKHLALAVTPYFATEYAAIARALRSLAALTAQRDSRRDAVQPPRSEEVIAATEDHPAIRREGHRLVAGPPRSESAQEWDTLEAAMRDALTDKVDGVPTQWGLDWNDEYVVTPILGRIKPVILAALRSAPASSEPDDDEAIRAACRVYLAGDSGRKAGVIVREIVTAYLNVLSGAPAVREGARLDDSKPSAVNASPDAPPTAASMHLVGEAPDAPLIYDAEAMKKLTKRAVREGANNE